MNRIFLLTTCFSFLLISACKQKPKGIETGDGYFISTQSQTDQRVKDLGMDKPSENASYILDKSKLTIPQSDHHIDNRSEFKADPESEWIINITLSDGAPLFEKSKLNEIFDLDWRKNFAAADIYGFAPEKNRWTYATAGKGPGKYTKLQVGVSLLQVFDPEKPVFDSALLDKYLAKIQEKLKAYAAQITPAEPVTDALAKAKLLVELKQQFEVDEVLILKADKTFKGMDVWDVLQCTGLKWGDGDLFHWENQKSEYGDESLFSVGTNTNPGYFLPENIKEGNMNPTDLVFYYSVPRSAAPVNIFDAMLNAIKYCQKRLGGKILNANGSPFNEADERNRLKALVNSMKQKGINPGSVKALTIF
ncbi:cell division protein ZipA C-terminal FtsZ-binding domain-containing protein [Mucilaginibacter angelicae]|uniref:Cell division protein ZipA n=1 Tax=Mucilaginibacter angelicae TaxID=869718 RepID=A0ABV6LHL5_9SPHI